jgi:hypothetical protein
MEFGVQKNSGRYDDLDNDNDNDNDRGPGK